MSQNPPVLQAGKPGESAPAPAAPGGDSGSVESALLRLIVDKLPAMIAYWDAGLRCRFANRAYERWFGVKPESVVGRDMQEFLGPLFALNRPHIEAVLRGEEQEFERIIPDPAGGAPRYSQALYVPDVVDDEVRGFCVLVVDITHRKRAEESMLRLERQLQAAQRLAAVSTLAAGVAHEINNPLAAVLANLDLTLEQLGRAVVQIDSIQRLVTEARDAGRRVAEIVQSMKVLARSEPRQRTIVDVNDSINRSIAAAQNAIRYRTRLVCELGSGVSVLADDGQLVQLLVNLLVNATQALPDESVERNEMRVRSSRLDDHVVIEVTDNGCGIPEELRARIFEPFFTTKDVGVGTGLGLSISSAIVASLGGQITVDSEVGVGTTFRVVLPAASAPVAAATVAPASARPAALADPAPTRLRVLVVDDEPSIGRSLVRVLDDHDVTVLQGGREAVERLIAEGPTFDLVLCDLMMPDVGGDRVYEEATRAHPDLARRFVIMTGGSFTTRGRNFLESLASPVLTKPFDMARLREVVHDAAVERDRRATVVAPRTGRDAAEVAGASGTDT